MTATPDDEQSRKRDLEAWARELVAEWPPLNPEQVALVARLLGPVQVPRDGDGDD